jgi:hypothetical protein
MRRDHCLSGAGSHAQATCRSATIEGGHFALFAGNEREWEASYELIDENTFAAGPPGEMTFDFSIEGDKPFTQAWNP